MNKLIRCIECNAIHAITSLDQAPEYITAADGRSAAYNVEYDAIEKKDYAAFAHTHAGHHTWKI